MKTLKDTLDEAIAENSIMALFYQGNPRLILPLVSGTLKNGIEAVLCLKYTPFGPALRVYHWSKIHGAVNMNDAQKHKGGIDYYLTKHFKTIYAKAA